MKHGRILRSLLMGSALAAASLISPAPAKAIVCYVTPCGTNPCTVSVSCFMDVCHCVVVCYCPG